MESPEFVIKSLGNDMNIIEHYSTDSLLKHLHVLRDHHLEMEYSVLNKYILITNLGLTILQSYCHQ